MDFKYTVEEVKIPNPKSFPADLISELQQELNRMKGVYARVKQASSGVYLGWDYQLPQGMSPRSLRALQTLIEVSRRLSVPLPEEEVGVGAVWEAVRVQAEQEGQLAGQGNAKLEGINTTGKGDMVLDLKSIAPATTFRITTPTKVVKRAKARLAYSSSLATMPKGRPTSGS